ncbi:hypothetical protein A2U01_0037253, partial [Trifolium medium]|nr:hypothetical protein [Trifolium medium]
MIPIVSLLKKAIGNYEVQGELPKELEVQATRDSVQENVKGRRIIIKEGAAVAQSLLQWKERPNENLTWEDDVYMKFTIDPRFGECTLGNA